MQQLFGRESVIYVLDHLIDHVTTPLDRAGAYPRHAVEIGGTRHHELPDEHGAVASFPAAP